MKRWLRWILLMCVLGAAYPLFAQDSPPTIQFERVPDFLIDGGVPNAALVTDDSGAPQVVLLYLSQQGLVQATSSDGVTFSGLNEPFKAMQDVFRDKGLFPVDVLVRQTASGAWRYFVKGLPPPGTPARHLYGVERGADGSLTLLNGGEPIYTGKPGGAERVEVPEIILTPDDTWRMFYVALGEPLEITHSAISSDEGRTWTFEQDNVFGDPEPKPGPRAEQINVDPAPFRLNDGSYVAATMRAGRLFFWTSADGLAFTPIPDGVLTAEAVRSSLNQPVTGLFDPTWVQLPDGTLYLYTTAGAEARGSIVAFRVMLQS
jgi:hypothetical protein